MKKESVIKKITDCKILPIYSHADSETVQQVVLASYRAGYGAFEFTNRVANALEVFKNLKASQHQFPELALGVGTVMNAESAQQFAGAGADFIVSPILKKEIGEVCKAHGVVWIPGCASPTEIITASEYGADLIKVFPASSLGTSFVSGVLSVAPSLKLLATGGIDPDQETISKWFKSGVVGVGLGSNLLSKALIDAKNWTELQTQLEKVRAFAQPPQ